MRQIGAILDQIQRVFEHRGLRIADDFQTAVSQGEGHCCSALIAVAIADGVGKGVSGGRRGHQVWCAFVHRRAIRRDGQGAVGAVDHGAAATGDGDCGVAARFNGDHCRAVCTQHIVGQYVKGRGAAFDQAAGIICRARHVIDDIDVYRSRGSAAIDIGGNDSKLFTHAVGAVACRMLIRASKCVAVGNNARHRVVPVDGKGVVQPGADGLHTRIDDAVLDDVDTADAQVLQAIERGDGERARLGQWPFGIHGCTARRQIAFIQGQLATPHVQPGQDHRIIVVVNVQHQLRGAGVTVRVGQGIGEGVGAITAAFEGQKGRIGRMHGVGISTVSGQHQGAIGPGKRTRRDRPSANAVGALNIVGQYVACELQIAFRGNAVVVVIDRRGHIVDHVGDQRTGAGGAIGIGGYDAELFTQHVCAIARCVRVIAVKCVGVSDDTRGGIVTGDCQRVVQASGDGLADTADHPAADHVNAAHRQTL